MENIIYSTLISSGFVLLLIGIVWKLNEKRVDSKVDKAYCKPKHEATDNSLNGLTTSVDRLRVEFRQGQAEMVKELGKINIHLATMNGKRSGGDG